MKFTDRPDGHPSFDDNLHSKNLKPNDLFDSCEEAICSSLVRATGTTSCFVTRNDWKNPTSSWSSAIATAGMEEILLCDEAQEQSWALWRIPTSDNRPRFEMSDNCLVDVDSQVILFCDNDALSWLKKNGFESDAITQSEKLRSKDNGRPKDSATVEQVETIVRATAPISPSNDEPISALINRRHQELDEELKPLASAFDLLVDEFIPESRLPSIHNTGTRRGFSLHMSPLARFSKCTVFCEGCKRDLLRAISLLKGGLIDGRPPSQFIDPMVAEEMRQRVAQSARDEREREQAQFHERDQASRESIKQRLESMALPEKNSEKEPSTGQRNEDPTWFATSERETRDIRFGDSVADVMGCAKYGQSLWALISVLDQSRGQVLDLQTVAERVDLVKARARAEIAEQLLQDASGLNAQRQSRPPRILKVGKPYAGRDEKKLKECLMALFRKDDIEGASKWRSQWFHWRKTDVILEYRASD